VVDASSIAVNRRYRRSKTDQLDVPKLLTMLGRVVLGESRRWTVVRLPSTADETLRQPQRALMALKEERPQHRNRSKGIWAGLGLEAVIDPTFPERLPALRPWDGQPVPALLHERLLREWARWALVPRQIQDWEHAEARMVRADQRRPVEQVRTLLRLRGIGAQSAWRLVHEVFGGREMQNRRAYERHAAEVAAEVEVDGEVFEGETRDVSLGGVKVLVSAPIDEGSAVLLTLILTEDGIEDPDEDPFEVEATVMWAAPSDTGGAMLGLRFGEVAADQSKRLSRFLAALDGD